MRRTNAVPTVHALQHGALRCDYSLLCRARIRTGHHNVVAVAMLVAAAAVIAAYATAANASVASAVAAIATAAITAATHVVSPPPKLRRRRAQVGAQVHLPCGMRLRVTRTAESAAARCLQWRRRLHPHLPPRLDRVCGTASNAPVLSAAQGKQNELRGPPIAVWARLRLRNAVRASLLRAGAVPSRSAAAERS